jgi:hypothetical protein
MVAAGEQTERRGRARPVRLLLGGESQGWVNPHSATCFGLENNRRVMWLNEDGELGISPLKDDEGWRVLPRVLVGV